MGIRVTKILHASVNTAVDAEAAATFYRDVLQLPQSPFRPDIPGVPGQWFDVADVQVHLIGFPSGAGVIDPTRHHICFGVENLDAAVAELDARAISYVRGSQELPSGTVHQAFFTDPCGNTIELQHDPRG